MRLFPGRQFRALDCSGILNIGNGVTAQIATLSPMPGFRFLRLTGLSIATSRSGGATPPYSLISTTVSGLRPLLDNLLFPSLNDVWRLPLMHEIDAFDQGTISLTSAGTFNYAFRLDGFYHNGPDEPEDPDIWRPHARSIPFNVSGKTPGTIANGAEGSVLTFETGNTGRGVRIYGAAQATTQSMGGRLRFNGEGFEAYRDTVLPVFMGGSTIDGFINPILAVLPPRRQYEVRFLHTIGALAGSLSLTLFGYTLP